MKIFNLIFWGLIFIVLFIVLFASYIGCEKMRLDPTHIVCSGLELADVSLKHIDLVPNQTKNLTFIFHSSRSGKLNITVKRVSTLFSEKYKEMPGFIKIRVEPSEIEVEPDKVYKMKVSVTATEEAKNFAYWNQDIHNATVIKFVNLYFVVEAEINDRTAKEWFSISILPPRRMDPNKPVALPGRIHLMRERFPSNEHPKYVELERGMEVEIPFEFYSGSFPVLGKEGVRITLYLVKGVGEYERLGTNLKFGSELNLKATIEPPSFLVCPRSYYKARIKIDARNTEAKEYVVGVFVHHGSTILSSSWISVRVK